MEDDTAKRQAKHASDAELSQWDMRYSAAWSALNDSRAMAGVYRLVASMGESHAPYAKALAGHEALLSAHRIGLLPGSFNPLTLAHTALARAARRAAGLDLIAWAIAARTVDKEGVVRATVADRLAQLASYAKWTQEDAALLVNRGLYVEQAEALRSLVGEATDVAIVVGFDKIVQIFDPHYYTDRDTALRELFARARLLVAPRQNDDEASLHRLLAQPQNARYAQHVTYVNLEPRYRRDSSTDVRQALSGQDAALQAIRPFVPPEGYALARLDPYQLTIGETDDSDDTYARRVRRLSKMSRDSSI